MDELRYLISLGFSGSDMVRAVILLVLGSLFVTRRFPPLRMTIILLLIDQAWPIIAAMNEDGGSNAIQASIRWSAENWEDSLAGFMVRAAGFYIFVRGTFSLRRKLHEALPEEKKAGALPF